VVVGGQQRRRHHCWRQRTVLFANNDASNAMKLDPATGLATIIHSDTNTGGALSRSKTGALFLASRGLNAGILQLEPQRKEFASSFRGEPFECVGGVLNDLVADSRGGVYLAITAGGLFYANPKGVVSQYGDGISMANGIILSPDEKTLYVTNGGRGDRLRRAGRRRIDEPAGVRNPARWSGR
jgi:sugar lactone lactonase YvrE